MMLDEIHLAELKLMQRLRDFCEELGLVYYLAYGSLLGAVRHQGFIPWDDDADIWMPRKDFEIFMKRFKRDNRYYLVPPFQSEYGFGWMKLVDSTTAYENSYSILPPEYGLSLDIFPLDDDHGKNRFELACALERLRRNCLRNYKNCAQHSLAKHFIKKFVSSITPTWLIDERGFSSIVLKGKSTDRYINYLSRYSYKQESMKKEWFGEGQYVPFEHDCFRIPLNAETILEQIYGSEWRTPVTTNRHARVYWREHL